MPRVTKYTPELRAQVIEFAAKQSVAAAAAEFNVPHGTVSGWLSKQHRYGDSSAQGKVSTITILVKAAKVRLNEIEKERKQLEKMISVVEK